MYAGFAIIIYTVTNMLNYVRTNLKLMLPCGYQEFNSAADQLANEAVPLPGILSNRFYNMMKDAVGRNIVCIPVVSSSICTQNGFLLIWGCLNLYLWSTTGSCFSVFQIDNLLNR